MNDECTMDTSGNCQHVKLRHGDGSLTIPSGTHYISGATVHVNSSSDLAATSRRKDDLAGDLLQLVDDARQEAEKKYANQPQESRRGLLDIFEKKLMIRLVIFIVERDHKVLQHGIGLGRAKQ